MSKDLITCINENTAPKMNISNWAFLLKYPRVAKGVFHAKLYRFDNEYGTVTANVNDMKLPEEEAIKSIDVQYKLRSYRSRTLKDFQEKSVEESCYLKIIEFLKYKRLL